MSFCFWKCIRWNYFTKMNCHKKIAVLKRINGYTVKGWVERSSRFVMQEQWWGMSEDRLFCWRITLKMFLFQITSAAETIHKTVTDIKVKHKEDLVVPFGVPWFSSATAVTITRVYFVLFESSELYVLFALKLFWNQLQWYSVHYGRK